MEGYTNFTKVYAEELRGSLITGPVTGNASTSTSTSSLTGSVISANTLSKADNYSLAAAEIAKFFTGCVMTAASKTLTLGLAAGQAMIVMNTGATNAYTVKNIAADTGTSLGTSKAILVIGATTADASLIIALN